MPPASKGQGHIVVLSVFLSVHLSLCPKLNQKTKHFPVTPKLIWLKANFWYEVTSHRYTSAGTKVKVICNCESQISGSHFSKNGHIGGISVSQTHFVSYFKIYKGFLMS